MKERRVAAEMTTKDEIDDLRALYRRYLADARIEALSDDGRFDRAYGAARTLATMIVRIEGYRVKAQGGAHFNTFLALEAAAPGEFAGFAEYFDTCRTKRNELTYNAAFVVSETEVDEIIAEVERLERVVRAWIAQRKPEFKE